MMKRLEDFVKPTQDELFSKLRRQFGRTAHIWYRKRGYILVKGDAPVMLLAHMDTVHKQPVKQICVSADGDALMSPQGIGGDDRCGVYALVTVYNMAPVKPWLLFTCDEEVGGKGADKFCDDYRALKLPKELDELKFMVEIDRAGKDDAVYYDCGNPDFEEYITGKGFKTQFGSFSDISVVAPEIGVAAVNLSSGYYNAHTQHEYIVRSEIDATIRKVNDIVADAAKPETPTYEYIETVWYPRYRGSWGWSDLWGQQETVEDESDDEITELEMDELRQLYDDDELEWTRGNYGNAGIHSLFEDEFGCSYADMFPTDDEEMEENDDVAK